MNLYVPTLAVVLALGASALGQQPVEPGFPVPMHAFDTMPPDIARQLRCDLDRVNADLRRMMAGLPVSAVPLAPPCPVTGIIELPALPEGSFQHREESSFSCVNGCFSLRHRLNAICYRISGTMRCGRACVNKIIVDEGDGAFEYPSVDELPASHRTAVRNLLRPYESIDE